LLLIGIWLGGGLRDVSGDRSHVAGGGVVGASAGVCRSGGRDLRGGEREDCD
jgi:hypothetical protein